MTSVLQTTNRYLNPLLWGFAGWLFAVGGNHLALMMPIGHKQLIHVDEVFVAVCCFVMRWLHGEFEVRSIYQERASETKIRRALQILLLSEDLQERRAAAADIIEAMQRDLPVRPGLRIAMEDFVQKMREKLNESNGKNEPPTPLP